jgi:hypothetical protein
MERVSFAQRVIALVLLMVACGLMVTLGVVRSDVPYALFGIGLAAASGFTQLVDHPAVIARGRRVAYFLAGVGWVLLVVTAIARLFDDDSRLIQELEALTVALVACGFGLFLVIGRCRLRRSLEADGGNLPPS